MKKSTKLLTLLLALLLVFSLVIMAACTPPEDPDSGDPDDDQSTVTDTSAIANGSFATATGPTASYVKSNVTGWTISSGGSMSTGSSNVSAGVVDLFGDVNNADALNSFNARKGEINTEVDFPGVDPKTPKTGDKYSDTNALVISIDGSNKGSIYFSASDEAVVKSGKYYKLTLSVWTHLLNNDGQPLNGAAIVVRGDSSVDYFSIDTQKNWQTYEIYIEGSDFEDREIYIQLWLGHGPANLGSTDSNNTNYSPYFENGVNPYLAKGTVFFDNVKLDEVTSAEFTDAFNDVVNEKENTSDYANGYNQRYDSIAVEKADGGRMTAVSMKYPDPNFTAYRAHTSSSSASTTKFFHSAKLGEPENFTFVVGKEGLSSADKDDFPAYSTSANNDNPKGIFDYSKLYELLSGEDGKPATEGGDATAQYGDTTYQYTDLYHKLDSEFVAPALGDFYNVGEGGALTPKVLPDGNSLDSTALLIYHPENAIISVWVYIWVPEIDEPRIPRYTGMDGVTATEYDNNYDQWLADFEAGKSPVTDEADDNYDADYNEFYKFMTWINEASDENDPRTPTDAEIDPDTDNADELEELEFRDFYNDYYTTTYQEYVNGSLQDYLDYMQYVGDGNKADQPKATVKLTGADIKDAYSTPAAIGGWEQVTLYVQGNALADRNLQLALWYGEGEWGDDTLYPGGCFFDNLTVSVYEEMPDIADAKWQQISVIEADSYDEFDLDNKVWGTEPDYSIPLTTEKNASDEAKGWYYKPVDDRSNSAYFDVKYLPYAEAAANDAIGAFDFTKAAESGDPADYETVQFDVIQYSHTDYTASTLYFIPTYTAADDNAGTAATSGLHITPNKFYRLSLWAKTANLAEGSAFTVSVFDRETDAVINSSATVADIGELSDWTEISILFRANAVTANDIYIVIEFGEGVFFNDADHAKGTIYLSAFTYQQWEYSEYNDATTGTYVKKASLASSGSYGSVSNGNFGTISTDNYSEDEDREEGESIFDENGNLVGEADPDGWDDATAHTPIAAPTVATGTHTHIAWSVPGELEALLRQGVTFYIFMNDYPAGEGATDDDVPVGKLTVNSDNLPKKASDGDYDFTFGDADKDRNTLYNGEYYVRALFEKGGKYYVSAASSVVNITSATNGIMKALGSDEMPDEHKSVLGENAVRSGVINVESYDFTKVGLAGDYVMYGGDDDERYALPVYSSSDKSEKTTKIVHNSGYGYKLDESWSKILIKSWDMPQSWWDASKRRKRLAEVLLYPMFRMLPIKKKTVMFESFWGRSTDCNPYAFYEWMDKNHPEYECVWSVNDTRMHLDGNGKKVKRGSLAYMTEMARAKFFLNNVNFMDNHVKRPHQIEIQTMHGTPLKTLGLDVPGDFPTQASIDKFLRKCNRWDYLIVQGKKTEEITKSCYRFDRTFLETGYPRNDELFNGNTPENIARIKEELGLDPSKKLVLYAPTWRISNRFDLMLDLGKMCDVIGDEYQVALRVHHLAAAGLHESELDPRVINLTNAPSISDLYLITDVLITDYSSVMFDYACVKKLGSDERKPMIFFPYDLEDYRDNLRGFNIDLETEAPGPILLTSDEVIDAVKNIDETEDEYRERYDEFVKKFIEFEHGNASAEVFEQVFECPIK